jgi:hypothetical protein
MANKEEFKDSRRKQINRAAGSYLCDQDEGDCCDAYALLLEESDKGNGDKRAADFVTVWQPLENSVSVDEMIRLIEDGIDNEMPKVLGGIDWELLKQQKKSLLKVIEDCDNVPVLEHLEGILVLIDALQDAAVDEYGVEEKTVFDLHGDEEVPEVTPEAPVSTRYKVWVEIERIETDKEGNETYHDEDFPVGLAYEDSIEDAVELQKIINHQYGRLD